MLYRYIKLVLNNNRSRKEDKFVSKLILTNHDIGLCVFLHHITYGYRQHFRYDPSASPGLAGFTPLELRNEISLQKKNIVVKKCVCICLPGCAATLVYDYDFTKNVFNSNLFCLFAMFLK